MSSLNRLVRQATRFTSGRGGAGRPAGGRRPAPRGGAHGGGSTGSRIGSQVGRMLEGRLGGKGRGRKF